MSLTFKTKPQLQITTPKIVLPTTLQFRIFIGFRHVEIHGKPWEVVLRIGFSNRMFVCLVVNKWSNYIISSWSDCKTNCVQPNETWWHNA